MRPKLNSDFDDVPKKARTELDAILVIVEALAPLPPSMRAAVLRFVSERAVNQTRRDGG